MSTLDYHSEAVKQGIERLKLLGKYSDVLMQNYYGVALDEVALGARTINQLLDAHILWRPDEESGLKLSDPVREMIVHLIADEQRRKVNSDIGDFLLNIRRLVGKFNEAEHKGNYQSSAYLQTQLTGAARLGLAACDHAAEADPAHAVLTALLQPRTECP